MVPWRATEEGYVTDEVIEWYERFARGMPGAIVVEATGIRDVPSGPLLRIGHDRFLPGLRRLVETVRRASGGRTRLLVQLIDFLAVRRRPEPRKFFERFLAITDRHRAALGEPHLSDADVRVRLSAMGEDELAGVLARDELEALQFGYRERVTDMHRPHIRNLRRCCRVCSLRLPFARRRPVSTASNCTTRTPIRCRRFSPAPTRGPTAMAARSKIAPGCRLKFSL